MKKVYLFLLLCMAGFATYAQTAASYNFSRFTGTFNSIIGGSGTTSASGIICDDCTQTGLPIGFSFTFCGTSYTQLSACSNGWLSLANHNGANYPAYNTNIGGAGWIMCQWRDAYGGNGGSTAAYYQTSGTPGSRVFTFEWANWNICCGTGYNVNCQVKLYEGSNIVQCIYGTVSTAPTDYGIGIANSTSDFQVLPNATATTCVSTGFGCCSGTSGIPANGTILQWCAPAPAIVGGTAPFCAGTTTALTNASPGGMWSSANPSIATVGSSTGIVSGVAAGTATISYTPTCGAPVTKVVTVNPLPPAPSGSVPVCPANTITLTNSAGPGTWVIDNPSIATVDLTTGVVTGVATGSTIVTFTLNAGGCQSSGLVSVNPLPAAITGITSVCPGNTISLADATPGGTWSSSNIIYATVGSATGIVTGVATGSAVITYTAPVTGCIATQPVTIYPIPAPITGITNVCPGLSGTVSDGTPGGTWSTASSNLTIGSTSGLVTGITTGTAVITYTAPTGCIITSVITINPAPPAISGTTNVCVGSSRTLTNAITGGTWATSNTAVATVGVSSGVVTGVSAGAVTITYTVGTTGCQITTPFLVNPLPAAIGGSGNVCHGATTTLTNTGGGTWSSGTPAVASVGLSSGVVSGLAPGSSLITYTLPTGCSANLTVFVNALPTAYAVTGGGGYCIDGSGLHVGLAYSGSGIDYQLLIDGIPSGPAVPGSNSGLDFGLQTDAGTYTVVATNPITNCSSNMTGSVIITINPLPVTYNMGGGGNYCVGAAGMPITTDGSQAGVQYQLYNGISPVGAAVTGTGSPLNFGLFTTAGTYTVWATNTTTGCTSMMAGSADIIVNPLPTAYTVSGGGSLCAGGTGVAVLLSGSEPGNSYQVYNGGAVGAPVTGTGGPLNLGSFNAAGTYTVAVTDAVTGCPNNMMGSATIVVNPLPAIYTVTGGGGYCSGGPGRHVGLSFSGSGINYQLWYNGSLIATVAGSGSGLDFGFQTGAGIYTVYGINAVTGCMSTMAGNAIISVNPLPLTYTVTGGGSYCLGSPGVSIGTDVSDGGVNYQLFRGITPVGIAVAGTGGALDFGIFTTPGTYTVVATNAVSACAANLVGGATVVANPLPSSYTVTGGGNYCTGGSGASVALSNSAIGVTYELFLNGSTTSVTLAGTGASLDFGLQTAAGVYTVIARNDITGCVKNMLGGATVGISPLPNLFNVTGGGTYCSGGSGVIVGLDGSNSGISYRLHNSLGAVGPALSGTGGALNFGLKTVADNYFVIATNPLNACEATMNGGAAIATNPLPADYATGGGGNYCAGGAGVTVFTAGSDIGFDYELYRGGVSTGVVLSGSGLGIDFGPQTAAGVYNVRARDMLTGCTKNMPGSVVVNIISPTAYTVTGGGNYCAGGTGVHVGLSSSQAGVDYQLYSSGMAIGAPLSGTGFSLDFGLQTTAGIDSIVATDVALGCMKLMTGTVTVGINPLPSVNNVTGGGVSCAGGAGSHVGLDNSGTGIRYQLYNGVAIGAPLTGTGTPLDFGAQAAGGTYTVIATNITTLCSENMAGSAVVTVRPLPGAYAVKITGPNPIYPGYYCAADSGVHIYLPSSDGGVNYQLYRGATTIGGAVAGTGSLLDFGIQSVAGNYTVTALDTSGCANNMLGSVNVNIVPLPTVYNVTGGGDFCRGGGGVSVGLDGSETGIYYELFNGPYSAGSLAGTGAPLDFGPQIAVGSFVIRGNSVITECPNYMLGSASVSHTALLTPTVTIQAYPGIGVGVWHVDSLHAFVTNGGSNPAYQWTINGHVITGETNASFTRHEFFNNDIVGCRVTASGPCGGNTTTQSVVISLHNVGVDPVSSAAADIRLIPNPNKGIFTVKGTMGVTTDQEVSLEVLNMLGQVVYSGKVLSQNGNIDERIQLGSTLSNGMYLLNLRSGTEHKVFHFVVEQ